MFSTVFFSKNGCVLLNTAIDLGADFGFHPVKIVDPIGFQEVDEKYDAAQCPGDGIGPGNGGQLVDDLHRHRNVCHPENTPAGQHGKHGNGGFSRTAHDAGNAVGKGKQAVKQTDGAHMPGAKVNGLGRIAEKANELGRKQVGKHADHLCHDAAAGNTEPHALFDPVVLMRTQILPHKGGKGLGEAGDRQEGKAFQLGVRAAACHGILAEAVDVALHKHICHSDDAVLHTGGKSVTDDVHKAFLIKADLFQLHPIRRVDTHQMDAQHSSALIPWDTVVAMAAEPTPKPSTATNSRSSTTLVQAE